MISEISVWVTPLLRARAICTRSCSGRYIATSAATVIRLRSRLESSVRSHTSPKTTLSVRSISLGTVARTFSRGESRADFVDDDVAIVYVPPISWKIAVNCEIAMSNADGRDIRDRDDLYRRRAQTTSELPRNV